MVGTLLMTMWLLASCGPTCTNSADCGTEACIEERCASAVMEGGVLEDATVARDTGGGDADGADAGTAEAGSRDGGPADAGGGIGEAPSCGDGVCELASEDSSSCAVDCFCGDGVCLAAEETRATCATDCGPTFDRLDWLTQDRVAADPTVDPYCVPNAERMEQDAFTPIHFVRVDQAGRQNFTSYRVRAFHDQTRWVDRAITLFDAPPHFQSQRSDSGSFRTWGGDTMESEGPLVSIVGTNDGGGGTTGWFNNTGAYGCSYGDAWVLYDETDVPLSPGERVVNWSPELRSDIWSVRTPSVEVCPVARGIARTRWTFYPAFEYASSSSCTGEPHKRIDTIVSDHGPAGLSHHEVFYLTDEYGLTRWERWNCSATRQLEPPSPDYAAMRCNYAESESVMHMSYPVPEAPDQRWQILNAAGLYCVLADCRDATELVPFADPEGWVPAGWSAGAQVYFSSNLLRDGDFTWSDPGTPASPWSTQGTMSATVEADALGNQSVVLQTTEDGPGWFSQNGEADEFFRELGAGAASAGPLRVRFGARARLTTGAGTRTMQIAVVQWNADSTEQYGVHISRVEVGPTYRHYTDEVPLESETRRVQIRFSLGPGPGPAVQLDDAFVLIADTP